MDELQYQDICEQIEELKKRKATLEERIINNTSDFMTKFRFWYFSDKECHHEWFINQRDFPLLYKLMKDRDFWRRGETIDLERLFQDELNYIIELSITTTSIPDDERDEYNRILLELKPYLEEAMNGDMKSFKADW